MYCVLLLLLELRNHCGIPFLHLYMFRVVSNLYLVDASEIKIHLNAVGLWDGAVLGLARQDAWALAGVVAGLHHVFMLAEVNK